MFKPRITASLVVPMLLVGLTPVLVAAPGCGGGWRADNPLAKPDYRGETGGFLVQGKPRGARLSISGPEDLKIEGSLPFMSSRAPAGEYIVEVRAEGFADTRIELKVEPERMTAVDLIMERPGILSIDGKPAGSRVAITGPGGRKDNGALPMRLDRLAPGSYVVKVTSAGYAPYEQTVVVKPEATSRVEALLKKEGSGPLKGFVRIDAGEFQMGSPDNEMGRDGDEGPRRRVRLTRPYWVQRTEVTQRQWQSIMGGGNPAKFSACGPDCPVERVNWYEAITFLNRMSERSKLPACYRIENCQGELGGGCPPDDFLQGMLCMGEYVCGRIEFLGTECRGFRLPTEAEWEYAARAGTTTALYNGDLTLITPNNGPALDPVAWYAGNSGVDYEGIDCSGVEGRQIPSARCGPHPVGRKQSNPWALSDMLGNVFEWTNDAWDPTLYANLSDGAENPGAFALGGRTHVIRGGAWLSPAPAARAAYRGQVKTDQLRSALIGFRPVKTFVPEDEKE